MKLIKIEETVQVGCQAGSTEIRKLPQSLSCLSRMRAVCFRAEKADENGITVKHPASTLKIDVATVTSPIKCPLTDTRRLDLMIWVAMTLILASQTSSQATVMIPTGS